MLKQIVVTNIDSIYVVNSPRGRRYSQVDRPNYGLSLCQGGRITYEHNGRHYDSDTTNAILLPKGESYSLYGVESGIFPVVAFQCMENFSPREFLVVPLQHPEKCLQEFRTLQEHFFFTKDHAMCMSSLYRLFSYITEGARPVRNLLDPDMEYLQQHLSSPDLNNSLLAEQAGISEVYFRRLFRETYGVTPKQYIVDMRLRLARQLLTNTDNSIGEIADCCGFSSVYYFSRAFHQAAGQTPTDYRRDNSIRGI